MCFFFWLVRPLSIALRSCTYLDTQVARSKRAFFHECKEDWHEDQDVDGGRNHSSDDGCGNWLHHVRTDATLPENRHQARENSGDGHQFWPQSLYGPFKDC